MHLRFFFHLVFLLTMRFSAWAALPAYSESAAQAWWSSRPAQVDYPAEAAKLKAALLATQLEGTADLAGTVSHAKFQGWLELACWLNLYPREPGETFLTSADGRAAFTRVGSETALRQLFLAHLSSFDNAGKALEIFCRIAHAEPMNFRRLPQLALAFALVWDQPFPAEWPHRYVNPKKVPLGDSDPVARFQAYCKIAQGLTIRPGEVRTFLIDPARLATRDLMFVVDTPLDFKEVNYILQVKLNDPSRLNDLFPQVTYDAPRMNRGELQWPHDSYRLIDIGKKGGICADQAYFVAMAGKAQGIPTVLLFGQGTTGGHAWVGYEGAPGNWTLNVARYKEGNYTSGRTYDPQTWRSLTDSQLAFLTREPTNSASALKGRLLMHWAQMHKLEDWYPAMLGLSRTAWLRSFDIWELQAQCLEDRKMAEPSRVAFWERWNDTFREDRDMRFRGQSALLKIYEANSNTPAATKLRAQMMQESQHTRFDLAIRLASAPVFDLVNAKKWPEAHLAFLDLLKRQAREAEGNLFYNLVQPYVEQALEAGQKELASTAYRTAKPLFKIVPLSTLAVDFKALETELGL
jgi:hypothetical protein